jgi:alpha-amylase
MNPKDIQAILGKVKNLNTDFGFKKGARPFVYQEVIDLGNEPISAIEYVETGRVTEFKYGSKLGRVFRKEDQAKWLNNFGIILSRNI